MAGAVDVAALLPERGLVIAGHVEMLSNHDPARKTPGELIVSVMQEPRS
jgi:hypothetical protein